MSWFGLESESGGERVDVCASYVVVGMVVVQYFVNGLDVRSILGFESRSG